MNKQDIKKDFLIFFDNAVKDPNVNPEVFGRMLDLYEKALVQNCRLETCFNCAYMNINRNFDPCFSCRENSNINHLEKKY